MTNLRQRWCVQGWGSHMFTAVAISASLAVALAIALVSSSRPAPLATRGTPLPLPSTPAPITPTPTAVPTQNVTGSGSPPSIGLDAVGMDDLVALTATGAALSIRGTAWTQIPVPLGADGLVVDRADVDDLVTGGTTVRATSDTGRHWAPTPAQPSGSGPFLPLLISPWDPRVLFVSDQSQVAVTTDGGGSWQGVTVPTSGQPVMASGNAAGTFFLSTGGSTYQLVQNGAKVNARPALPAGVTVTELSVGQYLLVACCSGDHLFILRGVRWAPAPIMAAGPLAVDGTDIWAAAPPSTASAPPPIEESSDGGSTWQARPGLPAGESVVSLTLSADGHTVYALDSIGDVYEAQRGIWYLLSSGLQLSGAGG